MHLIHTPKHTLTRLALALAIAGVALTGLVGEAAARDQIRIVGSSTVYPFTTIVAERFGQTSGFKTPVVESTGTGGGMKLFCAGIGTQYPDLSNASRPIKPSEIATCRANGVDFIEIIVGNDGLAFANARTSPAFTLTRAHIAVALAAELPGGGVVAEADGAMRDNMLMTWEEVDAFVAARGGQRMGLPAQRISVMVPPPTSGTRDALGALLIEAGLGDLGIAESDDLREDGVAIEVGENDSLIIERLVDNRDMFGVFGYSFLDQNRDKVRAASLNGVDLNFESIASYEYPAARPLFFYIKKQHVDVIPGLREFIAEFVSDRAMGLDGYLFPAGLVPLTEADTQAQIAKLADF
ncbi:MAG: substrate-binding domain-containing protein [Proteobacteria bacterium]|nr:substrate-binding domain-containing protein [Pseudomonadota bacterium]